MTLFKSIIFLTLISYTSIGFSQNTSKETIVSDATSKESNNSIQTVYPETKSKKAQAEFESAEKYFNQRDYKNAEKHLLKALKVDAKFVEAYDKLGEVYLKLEKSSQAKESFQKSIKILPNGIFAHQSLANIYVAEKDYQNAIKSFKRIIKISPNDAEGYYGVANSLMMLREFEEASKYAEKALKIYERNKSSKIGDGYYMVALVNYHKGDKENAKKYFELARAEGVNIHPQIEFEIFGKDENVKTGVILETKEDFKKNEKFFIDNYKWYVQTSIGQEASRRQSTSAFLLKYITGCPYISVKLSPSIVTFTDCSECLLVYMGGWAQKAIEAENQISDFEGALAGVENVIDFYQLNKNKLGENKELEKLIELQTKNKLRDFIAKGI